jgi:tyrosyl-tRNA synthetase
MWDWLLLLTDVAEGEIAARKRGVAAGELHPKAVKQELARTLVAQYHDADAARDAEAEFERVFAAHGEPDEIKNLAFRRQPVVHGLEARIDARIDAEAEGFVVASYVVVASYDLLTLLVGAQLVSSKNEARRLIDQGGVQVDGVRVTDPNASLEERSEPYLLKVGKRRFARLLLS